jgi:hypothetical protein
MPLRGYIILVTQDYVVKVFIAVTVSVRNCSFSYLVDTGLVAVDGIHGCCDVVGDQEKECSKWKLWAEKSISVK